MFAAERTLLTYALARLLPAIASFMVTLVCIEKMLPRDYALLSLTLMPVTLCAGFAGGVAGQAMMRYGQDLSPEALQQGLVAVPVGLALLLMPLALVFMPSPSLSLWLILSALSLVPLIALTDTRRSLLIARGDALQVLRLDLMRSVGTLTLVVVGFGVATALPVIAVVAQVLAALAGLALVRVPTPTPNAGVTPVRRVDSAYLRYGVYFAIWSFVVGSLSFAERSLIEQHFGLTSSGTYSAKADVINAICAAVGGVVGSALMPHYLAAARGQATVPMSRLLVLGLWSTAGAAVLCTGLVLVAAFRVEQSGIGHAFASDLSTALILVVASALWLLAVFIHKPLELGGNTGAMLVLVVIASLVFVISAGPLMQRWGVAGVAIAKVFAGVAYVAAAGFAPRWIRLRA